MDLIDFLQQRKARLEGDNGFVLEYCDLCSTGFKRISITVRRDELTAMYSDPRMNHDLRKSFITWYEMEQWAIEFLEGTGRNPELDALEADIENLKRKYQILLKQENERKAGH